MSRPIAWIAILLLAAVPAAARKPKPPPCDPGTFVVSPNAETLLPEADVSQSELIAVGADGMVSVSSGCPAVLGKVKAGRKGTKVSAKWAKATCSGLPKKVKLKAKFDETCQVLTGKLKSKKHKRPFAAQRVFETEGFGAPSLDPILEPEASLSRTIGPEGGEVLTWGADGTAYRLYVPAGVLDAPTAITITPAVSIGNLPLEGGLLQAVALEPAGLAFSPSATLSITPAEPLPDEVVAGFGWSGDDDAFGVAPWWLGDGGVHVQIDHFSGYGIGIPGPSQLETLVAELLTQQGAQSAFVEASCLFAEEPCTPEERDQVVSDWYDQLVEPLLEAGGAGPVEAIRGHQALLGWLAMHVAFGVDDSDLQVIARAQNLLNLGDVFATFTPPVCSGAVTDWRDWIRVPQELNARAREGFLYSDAQLEALDFNVLEGCAGLTLADLDFPDTLQDQQTELPLSFQSVVSVEGEPDVGVESEVDLFFGPGASGQGQLLTEPDGQLETEVSRDPTALRVAVDVVAVEPATGLIGYARVVAGSTEFAFDANLTGAAPRYVPTGGTRELCVVSEVGAPAGTQVDFSIQAPGTLAASSAPLADHQGGLAACVEYQAPGGPVGRNVAAIVTATMDFGGETYTDVVQVYPHWRDIVLQADVGGGLVDATTTTLGIAGDGPYPLQAQIFEAGEDTASPPVPVVGAQLRVETTEATLASGVCCEASLDLVTNSAGRAYFQWRPNGSGSTVFPIEVLTGNGVSLVAASVTLEITVWAVSASYPSTVEPEELETLTVTVTEDGAPVASAWIEVDVVGGIIGGGSSGTTNSAGVFVTSVALSAGLNQVSIEVRAYASSGGALLATQTVVATAGGGGLPAVSTFAGTLVFNSFSQDAELEMTIHPVTGEVTLRTCDGTTNCPLDGSCDALWDATLVGDELVATMVNHNGPCAIGQPGQNRVYGCMITATLSGPVGSRSLIGDGDGSFFNCPQPGTTFEVCEGGCAP